MTELLCKGDLTSVEVNHPDADLACDREGNWYERDFDGCYGGTDPAWVSLDDGLKFPQSLLLNWGASFFVREPAS